MNRVRDEMRLAARADKMREASAAAPASQMAQEALFEYHLYTLARPTTIADNQTKQVALLGAQGVPVLKRLSVGPTYYYRSSVGGIGQKMKVGVFVQLENRESSRLGMPMPKAWCASTRRTAPATRNSSARTASITRRRMRPCA